jgi:hypothetical protein
MDGRTQLLGFIGANTEPTDPIRVMKGLFLFTEQAKAGRLPDAPPSFDFAPMSFGPCAPEVYRGLEELVTSGLVAQIPVPGETWSRYVITDAGRAQLQSLIPDTNTPEAQYLQTLRAWTDKLSFTELLKAVYHAYPEFAVNSVLAHLRKNV